MDYLSTRDNHEPVPSADAIHLGMVPRGGLFVPRSVPRLEPEGLLGLDYRDLALRVLSALLDDFSEDELRVCVERAYRTASFDVESVVAVAPIGSRRAVLELWHGPTAAFKDVALQILPGLLAGAKRKAGVTSHTVILVATSGDTGKAALEGFKDAEGLSIIVFYPHGGVSEIQRLQMATTEGSNVHVVAVRGNFDDCQTGVKRLFGDPRVRDDLGSRSFELSSANSINWGRMCPQIVYYFAAWLTLRERGEIRRGEEIDFAVPTGNFGNILAGWYARRMGLPVRRLICASNRNRILSDFFRTGVYDRNREFFRTTSPSMDILISSNLERFVFEVTGQDAPRVRSWYSELERTGRFAVDGGTLAAMREVIAAGWVDEARVLETIGRTYGAAGYLVDTHTAVAVALAEEIRRDDRYVVIDATASPYKFSADVLKGLGEEGAGDEFASIARLEALSKLPVHRAVAGLREKPIRHDRTIEVGEMEDAVMGILEGVGAGR